VRPAGAGVRFLESDGSCFCSLACSTRAKAESRCLAQKSRLPESPCKSSTITLKQRARWAEMRDPVVRFRHDWPQDRRLDCAPDRHHPAHAPTSGCAPGTLRGTERLRDSGPVGGYGAGEVKVIVTAAVAAEPLQFGRVLCCFLRLMLHQVRLPDLFVRATVRGVQGQCRAVVQECLGHVGQRLLPMAATQ